MSPLTVGNIGIAEFGLVWGGGVAISNNHSVQWYAKQMMESRCFKWCDVRMRSKKNQESKTTSLMGILYFPGCNGRSLWWQRFMEEKNDSSTDESLRRNKHIH